MSVFWKQGSGHVEQKVGETPYLEDNHDPVWPDSHFAVALPPTRVMETSVLRLVVRDFDYDESCFLGHVALSGAALRSAVDGATLAPAAPSAHVRWVLARNRASQEKQFVSGELGVRLRVVESSGSDRVVHVATLSSVLSVLDANPGHREIEANGLALLESVADSPAKL